MDISKETILKYKRHKTTYVDYVDLHLKSQQSVDNLKAHLADLLNANGGLVVQDDDADGNIENDDDIPVPKSEYIDEEVDDDKSAIAIKNEAVTVSVADLRIAIPKDKTAPYNNEWIELVDNATVASIEWKDYTILAFAYGEEDFFITEAVYDE